MSENKETAIQSREELELQAITLYLLNGLTSKQVEEKTGLDHSTVCRLVKYKKYQDLCERLRIEKRNRWNQDIENMIEDCGTELLNQIRNHNYTDRDDISKKAIAMATLFDKRQLLLGESTSNNSININIQSLHVQKTIVNDKVIEIESTQE